MMQTKRRILDFYASKSWAILEANLQEMFEIYKSALERKALDLDFNPEAVAAKIGRSLDNTQTIEMRDGIAILPVLGPIFPRANLFTQISGGTSIEVLSTDFHQALDDRAVKAIVLNINSPGGEVDGTSELAQYILAARGQKPLVAYVGHLGASAAYWLASACDEIVCADTASLGSIGVVGGVRVSKDKSVIEFVSSRAKNKRPDPQTESGRAVIQSHVDALEDVFVEAVAANRALSVDAVSSSEGDIYVGRHAVAAGLADRVGTLESVIAELLNPERENVDHKSVLKLSADLETENIGAKDMPDKIEEKTNVVADEPKADLPEGNTAELEAAKTEAAETARKLVKSEAEKSELAKQVEALGTNVADLQKQARAARFAALSAEWIGEKATHLSMLELLSANGGEDGDLFKGYVTQQKAVAEQIATSALLSELGSSQAAEGSAEAEIEAKAVKMAADSAGKLTKQQAYDQIYSTDNALRARIDEESRRQTN